MVERGAVVSFMEFNDSLKVGNTVIDHEHQNLVRYINVLQQTMEIDANPEVIDDVLQGLTDYAAVHFTVEEELMKAYDYPDFGNHKMAHGKFTAKLGELITMYGSSRAAVAQPLLDFLMSWLIEHILKVDVKLAIYLREKGMS